VIRIAVHRLPRAIFQCCAVSCSFALECLGQSRDQRKPLSHALRLCSSNDLGNRNCRTYVIAGQVRRQPCGDSRHTMNEKHKTKSVSILDSSISLALSSNNENHNKKTEALTYRSNGKIKFYLQPQAVRHQSRIKAVHHYDAVALVILRAPLQYDSM
jgi:hypothetical protein